MIVEIHSATLSQPAKEELYFRRSFSAEEISSSICTIGCRRRSKMTRADVELVCLLLQCIELQALVACCFQLLLLLAAAPECYWSFDFSLWYVGTFFRPPSSGSPFFGNSQSGGEVVWLACSIAREIEESKTVFLSGCLSLSLCLSARTPSWSRREPLRT